MRSKKVNNFLKEKSLPFFVKLYSEVAISSIVSHLRHLSTIEGSAHALSRAYVLTVPTGLRWWNVVSLTHWECFLGCPYRNALLTLAKMQCYV